LSPPDDTPPAVQVSGKSFTVFGLPTTSNPLGFCHVKREAKTKNGKICRAKDCRNLASKSKGTTAKACCLCLHLLFASLQQFPPPDGASSMEQLLLLLPPEPSSVVSTPN